MAALNARPDYRDANLLLVGAGGIGCEVVKNLVMHGFHKVRVVDLDTIDVSNLNRQFLFHREHVKSSKAEVAVAAMRALMRRQGRPDAHAQHIEAYHGSIIDADIGVGYMKQFDLVINALDNNAARRHVNRLCCAADVTLVESGSAGYLGQVSVIRKGVSECYDCRPKPVARTYPGCTIRNTPSEPVHCVVWAKHLFNQLFGETDIDEDVAPDYDDPELADGATGVQSAGDGAKLGVRAWADSIAYDGEQLFNKLFHDDIKQLLKMDALWKTRQRPTPLQHAACAVDGDTGPADSARVWSMAQCARAFVECVRALHKQLKARTDGGVLSWDKDDDVAMDFVTAVAGVRSQIFGVARKSRFDLKSIAGNIIPAIANTNAIVGGCAVLEAVKALRASTSAADLSHCRAVFLSVDPNPRGRVLVDNALDAPAASCIVCASSRVYVQLPLATTTVRALKEKVLKAALAMRAPDANTDDGRIIISSDDDCDALLDKTLHSLGVHDGQEISADDFMQSLCVRVVLIDRAFDKADECEFKLADSPPDDRNVPKSVGKQASKRAYSLVQTAEEADAEMPGDGPTPKKVALLLEPTDES